MRRAWFYTVLVVLVLGGAAAVRIFGAWCFAWDATPVHTLATLVSRHMAAGEAFPVFGYGEVAMGTAEPLVGALMCRLFGASALAVNLGTALLSFLFVLVVFAWGRAAGGPWAGLAAAFYAGAGSGLVFDASCRAQGGYAALLLSGTLVMWLTCHIVMQRRHDQYVSRWYYLALGWAAGVGWWITPHVTVFFVAAAVTWVMGLGRRALSLRLGYAGLGFVLGGLPWWLWNVAHDWSAFSPQTWVPGRGGSAWTLSLWHGLPGLLGFWRSPGLRAVGVIVYVLMIVGALMAMARLRRQGQQGRWLCMVAAVVLGLSVLVGAAYPCVALARCQVSALLPLVPVLAVLLGVATAALRRNLAWGLAWIPLLILVTPHAQHLAHCSSRRVIDQLHAETVDPLVTALQAEGLEAVYIPYDDRDAGYGLNALGGGRVVFSDPRYEPYTPYASRLEQAPQIAVLEHVGRFDRFLAGTQGRARMVERAGFEVTDQIMAPAHTWADLGPELWVTARDEAERDVMRVLTDGRLRTHLPPAASSGATREIVVAFEGPVRICGFRVLPRMGRIPGEWDVTARAPDGTWRAVSGTHAVTGYFWSGPRPYWGGPNYRIEGRFPVCTTDRIRLRLAPASGDSGCDVAELQWFGPGPPQPDLQDALDTLAELLQQRGIRRLYSSQWVANRLNATLGGALMTRRDPERYPEDRQILPREVALGAWTALLVDAADACGTRRVLEEQRASLRETRVGPWVLFDFMPGAWRETERSARALHWVGYGCVVW